MSQAKSQLTNPPSSAPQTPDDLLNGFKKQAREVKEEKARQAAEKEKRDKEAAERKAKKELAEPAPFVAYFHKGGGCSGARSTHITCDYESVINAHSKRRLLTTLRDARMWSVRCVDGRAPCAVRAPYQKYASKFLRNLLLNTNLKPQSTKKIMTEKAQELQGSDIGSEISDDFSFDGDLKLLSSLSADELNSYHLIVAHIEEDDKVVVADTINKDDKLVYTVNDHKKAVSFDDFVTNFRAQLSESARKEHDSLVAMYGDRDSEDEKAYVAYNEKLIAVTDVLAMELEGSEGLQKVCDEQEDKDASAIEALAKRVVDHYKDKTNGKKLAVVMSDPISTLNVYPDEYEVLPYALRDALLDAEAEVVMLDEEDAEEEQEEKKEEGSAEDKKHFKELQEALATQLESLVVE